MKRFIIILIPLVVLLATILLYVSGSKTVNDKVSLQIININKQVEEFETRYETVKEKGNMYLMDIVQTCMTNKPTDTFKSLYHPQEDTHDGGVIDFCNALETGAYWDDYQLYCIDYAKAHDIKIQDLAEKVQEFNVQYESYDKTSEEWYMLMDTMPYYDNYYTFKFYSYSIDNVSYFATMYNDYITQLIEITSENGNKMTIELLWLDDEIYHVVRRM